MKVGICNLGSETFESDLLRSVKNTGFAVITNHGIDHSLVKDSQKAWRAFFTKKQKDKNVFINGNDTNMGYKAMGTETAVGSKVADIKEFFHWKPDEIIPEGSERVTEKLFANLSELAMQVLSVLQKPLNENFVGDCEGSPNTIFRTIYYPALSAVDAQEGAERSAAHEDINYITFLVAASAPGLQVKDVEGNWHDVPHEDNSVVMNIGDMLQLATNGYYKSTTHRVINPPDNTSDRISMPLFVHPYPDTILAPNKTAGQYLKERIDQIYGKK
jgi:isopenicillin N synthase-like dioxygenase